MVKILMNTQTKIHTYMHAYIHAQWRNYGGGASGGHDPPFTP